MSKLASGSTIAGNPIWHNGNVEASLLRNGSTKLPNGLLLQWGMYYHGTETDEETVYINFDRAFSSQVFTVVATSLIPAGSNIGTYDVWAQVVYSSISTSGFTCQLQSTNSDARSYGFTWFAVGI